MRCTMAAKAKKKGGSFVKQAAILAAAQPAGTFFGLYIPFTLNQYDWGRGECDLQRWLLYLHLPADFILGGGCLQQFLSWFPRELH